MNIFRKLFNKKPQIQAQDIADPVSNPANDPNLLRVFDKYGQELFIARDQWRTKVLPGTWVEENHFPFLICHFSSTICRISHAFIRVISWIVRWTE